MTQYSYSIQMQFERTMTPPCGQRYSSLKNYLKYTVVYSSNHDHISSKWYGFCLDNGCSNFSAPFNQRLIRVNIHLHCQQLYRFIGCASRTHAPTHVTRNSSVLGLNHNVATTYCPLLKDGVSLRCMSQSLFIVTTIGPRRRRRCRSRCPPVPRRCPHHRSARPAIVSSTLACGQVGPHPEPGR